MKVDAPADKAKESRKMIPEGDAYIKMLTQLVLLDSGRLGEAAKFSTSSSRTSLPESKNIGSNLVPRSSSTILELTKLLGDLSSIRPYIPRPSLFPSYVV